MVSTPPYRVRPPAPAPAPPAAAPAFKAARVDHAPAACAVLVAHGMGQQKPFDTLVQVANALVAIDRERAGKTPADALEASSPCAARIRTRAEHLARLELGLSSGRVVHVYESYWAPLTEGKVGLRDVIAFLTNAGFNGIWNFKQGGFKRWVLGRLHTYPIPVRHVVLLLVALIVIASLVAINAVIVAVSAADIMQTSSPSWLTPALLDLLSGASLLYLGCAGLFGALLLLAKGSRGTASARFWSWLARMAFFLLLLATCATAGSFGLALAVHVLHIALPAALVAGLERLGVCPGCSWLRYVMWPAVFVASALVRQLIVQYMGDVAAYISPHKLDKFNELRSQIKDCVLATARTVYGLRNAAGAFEYDEIVVVGHSLGSVIVYDCLNRLLNEDALAASPGDVLHVLERTKLLLTFGSPLDKTAFVFGTRGTDAALEGRSALAATGQPLILEPAFRAIPWKNIYSPHDIISGSLELYDPPKPKKGEPAPPPVAPLIDNRADDAASTWILAHTEYWTGKLVWELLHDALNGGKGGLRSDA